MIDLVVGWVNGKPRLRALTADECTTLLQNLNHPKARVRWMAADLLGKQRVRESIDSLVGALHDRHWLVRLHAVKALGRIGDVRAFAPLCAMLQDEHSAVRRRALIALGQLQDERAIPELLRIAQHDHALRSKVVESLANIVTPQAACALVHATTQPAHQPPIAVPLVQHLTPFLVLFMTCHIQWWQYAIIRWLGRFGDKGAIPMLQTCTTDTRPSIRHVAYMALGNVQYRHYYHLVPNITK